MQTVLLSFALLLSPVLTLFVILFALALTESFYIMFSNNAMQHIWFSHFEWRWLRRNVERELHLASFLGRLNLSNLTQVPFRHSVIFLIFPTIECSFFEEHNCWSDFILVLVTCCSPVLLTLVRFSFLLWFCLIVSPSKNRQLCKMQRTLALFLTELAVYVNAQTSLTVSVCASGWGFANLPFHSVPPISLLLPRLSVVSSESTLFFFSLFLLMIFICLALLVPSNHLLLRLVAFLQRHVVGTWITKVICISLAVHGLQSTFTCLCTWFHLNYSCVCDSSGVFLRLAFHQVAKCCPFNGYSHFPVSYIPLDCARSLFDIFWPSSNNHLFPIGGYVVIKCLTDANRREK